MQGKQQPRLEEEGGEGKAEPPSVKRLGVVKLYQLVLCCISAGTDKQMSGTEKRARMCTATHGTGSNIEQGEKVAPIFTRISYMQYLYHICVKMTYI